MSYFFGTDVTTDTVGNEMPDIARVVDKYQGVKFCDLNAEQQKEFLAALAQRSGLEALKAVGLNDANALNDMRDVRSLIAGYRAAKKTMVSQAIKTIAMFLTFWFIITFFPTQKAKEIIDLIR